MVLSKKGVALIKFWQNRSGRLGGDLHENEQRFFNEVYKELKPKSIIVFGCGEGREFGYTEEAEFFGVDFCIKYLKHAKRNYPKANIILSALQMLPFREGTTFDLGLTSTVLQHIPHADISVATQNMKSLCNAVILEEGVNIPESSYQFNHNYEALFEPMVLKKRRPYGINPYTHFFMFERGAPK